MGLSYAHEKFYLALDGMATSPASIQVRIADAYIYHLIHLQLDDLPVSIHADFQTMVQNLTSRNAEGDEGRVMATVRHMSDAEAVQIAQAISRMADIVQEYRENDDV